MASRAHLLQPCLTLSLDVLSRWDIILAVRSKPQHVRLGQPAEITVTATLRFNGRNFGFPLHLLDTCEWRAILFPFKTQRIVGQRYGLEMALIPWTLIPGDAFPAAHNALKPEIGGRGAEPRALYP